MTNHAPTPQQIDTLAEDYNSLDQRLDHIQAEADKFAKEPREKLAKLAAELKELVASFGSVHETKSKLLTGMLWEMMLTTSSSVSIENVAVERMLAWAKGDKKKKEIIESLFTPVTRWDLTPNATVIIQAPGIPAQAKKLFAACLKITPNQPRLKVRPNKAAKVAS
jgi:hypothetical protein